MAKYSKERASIIEPFIKYRIASNNWNEVYSETLLYFDRFCSENHPGVEGVTQEMIDGWCVQRPTEYAYPTCIYSGRARPFLQQVRR